MGLAPASFNLGTSLGLPVGMKAAALGSACSSLGSPRTRRAAGSASDCPRTEALALRAHHESQLSRAGGVGPDEQLQVWDRTLQALVRQVSAVCGERGALLSEARRFMMARIEELSRQIGAKQRVAIDSALA
jgi:hypothetical protein